MTIIETRNHGPLVASSTYWGSEEEREGKYYLTPNAGVFRLLVPRGRSAQVAEIRTAKEVVISIGAVTHPGQLGLPLGKQMSEILFDDRTDDPFVLNLSFPEQWERQPLEADFSLFFEFTAWEDRRGTPHKIISRPCYLRRADIPCLKPWPKPAR